MDNVLGSNYTIPDTMRFRCSTIVWNMTNRYQKFKIVHAALVVLALNAIMTWGLYKGRPAVTSLSDNIYVGLFLKWVYVCLVEMLCIFLLSRAAKKQYDPIRVYKTCECVLLKNGDFFEIQINCGNIIFTSKIDKNKTKFTIDQFEGLILKVVQPIEQDTRYVNDRITEEFYLHLRRCTCGNEEFFRQVLSMNGLLKK